MSNFTEELEKLHQLSGAEFSRQVERIALRKEFHPLETDEDIYPVGGEKSDRQYFEVNKKAIEVLIFKGGQAFFDYSHHCNAV